MGDIIVGGIVVVVLIGASYRSYKSIKSNKCPGCSGGCSAKERKKCKH
ncbi:MAG: FeoB-associated Cys-rich membrane protein [Cellulosilyticaceae bacterium]